MTLGLDSTHLSVLQYAGSAAYSDLVVLPDGGIGCLYERDDFRKITFAHFTLGWLTDGKDQP